MGLQRTGIRREGPENRGHYRDLVLHGRGRTQGLQAPPTPPLSGNSQPRFDWPARISDLKPDCSPSASNTLPRRHFELGRPQRRHLCNSTGSKRDCNASHGTERQDEIHPIADQGRCPHSIFRSSLLVRVFDFLPVSQFSVGPSSYNYPPRRFARNGSGDCPYDIREGEKVSVDWSDSNRCADGDFLGLLDRAFDRAGLDRSTRDLRYCRCVSWPGWSACEDARRGRFTRSSLHLWGFDNWDGRHGLLLASRDNAPRELPIETPGSPMLRRDSQSDNQRGCRQRVSSRREPSSSR